MKRHRRVLAWVAVLGLLSVPVACPPRDLPQREPSFALRLLGPVASLAATLQWARVDVAIRDGRTDLAVARAETALAIDPTLTSGWVLLARYFAFELGSADRQPNPAQRLAWLQAALAVLERGEATARDPGELCVWGGLLLALAATDAELPWPGGARAIWIEAAERFDRGAAQAHPDAVELATRARAEAAALGD